MQANILAATVEKEEALNQVYNIAFGERTTLKELFAMIHEKVVSQIPAALEAKPEFRDFRAGDVLRPLADIGNAKSLLG